MKLQVKLSRAQKYKIPQRQLVESVRKEFMGLGLKKDAEVNINFVDEDTMIGIAKLYLKENNTLHNVLSFPSSEVKIRFKYPKGVSRLGDIVICYNKAVEESKLEGVALNQKLIELATHGARHLMGVHHD